jgi:hypothetical protein
MAAALGCGSSSSKSKSSDDTCDAGSTDFGNAKIAGKSSGNTSGNCAPSTSGTGGRTSSSSGTGGKTSSSNPAPSTGGAGKSSGSTPKDAGVADEDSGSAPMKKPSGGGTVFDAGPLDASTDKSSNDDWINAAAKLVDMAGRSTSCSKPLDRDAQLDTAAAQLANDSSAKPDVNTKYQWNSATANTEDTALGILHTYIADNAPACDWTRYGLGIAGAAGGQRTIVFLLAE